MKLDNFFFILAKSKHNLHYAKKGNTCSMSFRTFVTLGNESCGSHLGLTGTFKGKETPLLINFYSDNVYPFLVDVFTVYGYRYVTNTTCSRFVVVTPVYGGS